MAQAQFISDGQADFFQNVLSYAFLSECQRMEPESAQQRLDRENRPWGPEAAEVEYYSVWVELWTVVESNFEQLFSLFHSTFFERNTFFIFVSSFSTYILLPYNYYSLLGDIGKRWNVWFLQINTRKAGVITVARLRLNALCELITLKSSASILIHDRSWLHAHRFNKFAAAGAISSASNIDAFSLKLSHAVFARFWAFIARCFVVYF